MRLTTLKRKEEAHEDEIWAVAWNPRKNEAGLGENDGKKELLTGSVDESCKVWSYDKAGGFQLEQTFEKQDLGVVSVDVNAAGLCATSTLDCSVKIFDIKEMVVVANVNFPGPENWSLAFHPNVETEQIALAAGIKGGLGLYKTSALEDESERQVCHLEPQPSQGGAKSTTQKPFALGCAYHPSGTKIACSHSDGHIALYDVEAQKHILTFAGHSKPVRDLTFTTDGNFLISACDDKTCNLYDISSKMPIGNLTGHDSSVLCLESIGDGGYCVTGSSDSKTKVWEIRSRTCVQTLSEHSGPIWDLAIDNTSNLLASGSEDGTVVTYAIN